ncbi:MAG: nodulation protein S NodS [Chloroflexi bacterium]|nr:nodulation protein S NodS [Chloroflexota bacterium]
MKSATRVFNEWVIKNKDDGMQRTHSPAVMDMLQYSLSRLHTAFSFIDAGCGNGWVVRYMNAQPMCTNAIGVDGADEMINKAKRLDTKGRYILSDLLDYQPSKKVALVHSMEVFYYFPDPSILVEHVKDNWIETKGRLIVGVDYYKENEACHNWSENVGTPMKMLSRKDWVEIFHSSGLSNIRHWLSCPNNDFQGTLVITGTVT